MSAVMKCQSIQLLFSLALYFRPTIKATVQMVAWMRKIQALWNEGILIDDISEALIKQYIQWVLDFFHAEMSIAGYLSIR